MRAGRCGSSKNRLQASPSAEVPLSSQASRITSLSNRSLTGLRITPTGAAIGRHAPEGGFSGRSPRRRAPDLPWPTVADRCGQTAASVRTRRRRFFRPLDRSAYALRGSAETRRSLGEGGGAARLTCRGRRSRVALYLNRLFTASQLTTFHHAPM